MKIDSTNSTIIATVVSQVMESLKNAPSLFQSVHLLYLKGGFPHAD